MLLIEKEIELEFKIPGNMNPADVVNTDSWNVITQRNN